MSNSTEIQKPIEPFRARVDASLITSASSFFDNSFPSVLRELLQNSRRSGATSAELISSERRWFYSDNGPGCMPQDLLGLGSSRWQPGVLERETPAGCGFFSLSRRNPRVACPSHNWSVTLEESHFNGLRLVEPDSYGQDVVPGLFIEFDRSKADQLWAVENIAQYMPISFYCDGKLQKCRQSFMDGPHDSVAHKSINFSETIRIRVDLVRRPSGYRKISYNGYVIDAGYYNVESFETASGREPYGTETRVEVYRERDLPLELPQRNKIIKSDTLDELMRIAKHVGLELAAQNLHDVCIDPPYKWLSERKNGYAGPVLYTKFIGRIMTRCETSDMSDYEFHVAKENTAYELGNSISFEEFEKGGYYLSPGDDSMSFLAQTTIPSEELESGSGKAYTIDVDTEFAQDLKLVKLPKTLFGGRIIAEGEEGYEWYARLERLCKQGSDWCDGIYIHTTRTDKDGAVLERDFTLDDPFDGSHLYDSLSLEFFSSDGSEQRSFPLEAVFDFADNCSSDSVEFMITAPWLAGMPSNFLHTVTNAAFKFRGLADDYEEDSMLEEMLNNLETEFAIFSGIDDYVQKRILDAALEKADEYSHRLPTDVHCIVVTIPVTARSSGICSINRSLATCEFVQNRKSRELERNEHRP